MKYRQKCSPPYNQPSEDTREDSRGSHSSFNYGTHWQSPSSGDHSRSSFQETDLISEAPYLYISTSGSDRSTPRWNWWNGSLGIFQSKNPGLPITRVSLGSGQIKGRQFKKSKELLDYFGRSVDNMVGSSSSKERRSQLSSIFSVRLSRQFTMEQDPPLLE